MDRHILIDIEDERECIKVAVHGGDVYSASEILGNLDVVDFSANINPLGVPDSVHEAIVQKCRKLREAIGEFHGIHPDQVVCGNGGADIIFRLVYSIRPKRALIPVPTFSEYGEALEKNGSDVNYFALAYPFYITDALPTGSLIDNDLMNEIMNYTKENNIYVLLDECFYDMTDDEMGLNSLISDIDKYPNLIILKSLTKLYAIP